MIEDVESIEEIEKEQAAQRKIGVVKRWCREKELADKRDKLWHIDAEEAIQIYRNDEQIGDGLDKTNKKETFNILWSNVETKRPALYSTTPRPDIRRRFKEKNDLAAAISELLERASTFTFESSNLDKIMIQAVNDMLTPGRAITRVLYEPLFSDEPVMEDRQQQDKDGNLMVSDAGDPMMERVPMMDGDEPVYEMDYEQVLYQQVPWKQFRMGPCKNWDGCPWILFIHYPTQDQVKEKWGEEWVKKLQFSPDKESDRNNREKPANKREGGNPESDDGIVKTTEAWEIWDKDTKEVTWVSPTYKDDIIEQYDDPLKMQDFWPIPEPLYAIECSTSTTPTTEYSMYRTLARELEQATNRIRHIMSSIKANGGYDGRMTELKRVMEDEDNIFIPIESSAALEAGTFEQAVFFLPIEERMNVVQGLRQFRVDLIQQIYEITGISDILRGSSNPHETLGATGS